ncbi:hypothetical protein [Caldisericum exile]|uniref:Uncharacterized protein n=1 Tax=Caldisericum exile (strain DSM 21853 / NBRC 104410 / AZM16c01) TaxID=511051 RepID=A0A7U6GEC1_CALEA|nr:hypothetical protein [Caldisericum exile]BAL80816.1 hypothetical protein CSE_06900 [Caldisericum exile AZM16c01]
MQEEKGDTYTTSELKRLERKFKLLEKNLKEEVSFSDLLAVRGFREFTYLEPLDFGGSKLFNMLSKYYIRRFLGDLFLYENLDEEELDRLTGKWNIKKTFIDDLLNTGILVEDSNKFVRNPKIHDFSFLIESFIAYNIKKKFDFDAILNVKLKELSKGGDIDILAKWKLELVMIELKESPPNNISLTDLKLTFDRFKSIFPDLFIFVLDTTLSIKRNIIDNILKLFEVNPKRIREGVYQVFENAFIVTAKRDLVSNVLFVIEKIIL